MFAFMVMNEENLFSFNPKTSKYISCKIVIHENVLNFMKIYDSRETDWIKWRIIGDLHAFFYKIRQLIINIFDFEPIN